MTFFRKIQFLICFMIFFLGCSTNELPPCGGTDCVNSCAGNFDCEPGLTCQTFQNGEVKICAEPVKKQTTNNTISTNNKQTTSGNNKTTTNNKTTPKTNNQTNNTTTPTNNATTTPPVATFYTHFLLRDQTSGKGCTAISNAGPDPGSDIMWISVLDNNGQTLGYARAVHADDGVPENGHNNPNILDGLAPIINAVGCTNAFDPTTVYSMGCNGTLVFSFNQNVTQGLHSVVVGEYGSTCNGSADDSYQLYACTDSQSAMRGEVTSCTVRVGGRGEGIDAFQL